VTKVIDLERARNRRLPLRQCAIVSQVPGDAFVDVNEIFDREGNPVAGRVLTFHFDREDWNQAVPPIVISGAQLRLLADALLKAALPEPEDP